jgi:hypothetical protein
MLVGLHNCMEGWQPPFLYKRIGCILLWTALVHNHAYTTGWVPYHNLSCHHHGAAAQYSSTSILPMSQPNFAQ